MWLELYLTVQELLNSLGNAGPLTEVAGSSVYKVQLLFFSIKSIYKGQQYFKFNYLPNFFL